MTLQSLPFHDYRARRERQTKVATLVSISRRAPDRAEYGQGIAAVIGGAVPPSVPGAGRGVVLLVLDHSQGSVPSSDPSLQKAPKFFISLAIDYASGILKDAKQLNCIRHDRLEVENLRRGAQGHMRKMKRPVASCAVPRDEEVLCNDRHVRPRSVTFISSNFTEDPPSSSDM